MEGEGRRWKYKEVEGKRRKEKGGDGSKKEGEGKRRKEKEGWDGKGWKGIEKDSKEWNGK